MSRNFRIVLEPLQGQIAISDAAKCFKTLVGTFFVQSDIAVL